MGTPAAHEDALTDAEIPDVSGIVIDDGEPVDNVYCEKQGRLLTEPLYSSWRPADEGGAPRTFVALSNVGLFASPHQAPLVPDAMLSLDVRIHPDFQREKRHRTYFIWEMGKPPEVVIEVVSNTKGDELGKRKRGYARWGVAYYVVWDPQGELRGEELFLTFERRGDLYVPSVPRFEQLGLELRPWEGAYEGAAGRWLRWYDLQGHAIPTGAERADAAKQEADAAKQEASAAKQEAAAERARAEHLTALLRARGIDSP